MEDSYGGEHFAVLVVVMVLFFFLISLLCCVDPGNGDITLLR